MSPPTDFKLTLVKGNQHQPPTPPSVTKPQIYQDISVFSHIDDLAIEEASKNHGTFRELVWSLCYKYQLTELEKARVIFRWLTCKDLKTISFTDVKNNSPEQLLTLFKEGRATYARIFECLARHSGLSCITILGWAKGVDYHPGINLTSKPVNHSWNAIYIEGNWQLVDCHWATRFLRSEHNSPENLVYEYDDFYFITTPRHLSLTHYPEDPDWLLTPPPVLSKAVFEEYPLLKSYFFTSGMRLLQDCSNGVVHTKYGVAVVSVWFSTATTYTFKLVHADKMQEQLDGVPLTSYVLQQTVDNQVVYHMRLPQKGDYYLIVFADVAPENPTETGEHVFKAVCEFRVVCDQPVKGSSTYPQCSDIVWGPDEVMASRFGLRAHQSGGLIEAPDGKAEVVFSKKSDVRLYPRLVKEGKNSSDLKKALAVKNEADTMTVLVELPEEGEYGLEVFANDQVKHGDLFTHISQYLLAYPGKGLSEKIGGVPSASLLDHVPAYVTTKTGQLKYQPKKLARAAVSSSSDQYPEGPSKTTQSVVKLESVVPKEEFVSTVTQESLSQQVNTKSPDNFTIQVQNPDVAPKPELKHISTQKLFINPTKVFKELDQHATQVSDTHHGSFKDILWHLIYSRNITNELDKARAIFLWLCSKDLSKLKFDQCDKGSPEEMLVKLNNGETTYAKVYETLCSYAGLHCKTLTGFAKGAEYKPGMKFSAGQKGQHSWNAVFVNGTWQLVDCHWAARRLVGDKTSSDNIRFELDEYYFMPAPSQLIFSHFPDDPSWQLLSRQLTQAEFEHLVPCKPAFFKHGLQLYSHVDAIIECSDKVTIRLDTPQDKNIKFTFNLKYEDGKEEHNGVALNQFAMLEMVGHACYITVRPPHNSSYLLIIYAKNQDQSKEGVYGGVCEYKVVSSSAAASPPFPPCVHSTWGPGDSIDKFDITPIYASAMVQTNKNGVADIKFKLNGKRLRFMGKLKAVGADEKQLSNHLIHRTVDDVAIFNVAPPRAGEFGLEVYANDPETGGQSLLHVYQYLVVCKDAPSPPPQPYPSLPAGYLGPQAIFDKIGLRAISHNDPFIANASGELHISFATTIPLRTSSQLMLASNDQSKDTSGYILQQSDNQGISFLLKFPEPGYYKFQLFGNPESEPGDSLVGVYNYLIHVTSTQESRVPFPKQYGPWKEGGYLYEPLEGHLQKGRLDKGSASDFDHIFFKLEIPKATAVVVVVGEEWNQLEKKEGSLWQGEIDLSKSWEGERKVMVCANVDPNDDTSYGTYLEYSM